MTSLQLVSARRKRRVYLWGAHTTSNTKVRQRFKRQRWGLHIGSRPAPGVAISGFYVPRSFRYTFTGKSTGLIGARSA